MNSGQPPIIAQPWMSGYALLTRITSAAASCGVSMWLNTPMIGHARVLRGLLLRALHAVLEVRRVLIAGENRDLALAVHQLGQLGHRLLAGLDVVDAVVGEALRLRRVAVERHHRQRRDPPRR